MDVCTTPPIVLAPTCSFDSVSAKCNSSTCVCIFLYPTIDVDSCGMVGGPDSVFSQAGVVTGIGEPNPLDVQTAVPPHSYILV